MRSSRKNAAVVGAVFALFAGGAWLAAAQTGAKPERRETRGANVLDVANMLSGSWKGSTPGNELNASVLGTGFTGSSLTYNLSTTVIGKYRDTNVWLQGVIHLENQGRDVFIAYIPHFNPAAGNIGLQALRFTRQELDSACSFYLSPAGDGYEGDTRGSVTCARAIRGAVGKWSLQIEPGSIRLRSAQSGETLRFTKSSK
jgi:hypothetical protein